MLHALHSKPKSFVGKQLLGADANRESKVPIVVNRLMYEEAWTSLSKSVRHLLPQKPLHLNPLPNDTNLPVVVPRLGLQLSVGRRSI
jgi:hypothetical protein